jgi:methylenetetrahydrofolate--tRNA-(uracil-5-)-methyltransferase
MEDLIVIGGGLAGSEAAWQAAEMGLNVKLYEMRPARMTDAHSTAQFAELVCSNSLGSNRIDHASGLLVEELKHLNSLLVRCAEQTALPAGSALAVDREQFPSLVTQQILSHPKINVVREEMTCIPSRTAIIASGPLSSLALSESIHALTGKDHLFFYDAASPIITYDSINMEIVFRGSRYGMGASEDGDYINCPFTREQYDAFVDTLLSAQRIILREFEADILSGVRAGTKEFFEGCLPVEVLAERGRNVLAFGPLRPMGLTEQYEGKRPFAVLQLRQDNQAGDLYNMVGFQTNLTFSEQRRVFCKIPGLEKAKFARYGQMHRNTYIASPAHLLPTLQFRDRENLFFAGQITGVEGYLGNIATGLLAGLNAARYLQNKPLITLPVTTMLGALCNYITHAKLEDFQPMKANFGILPELPKKLLSRRDRAQAHAKRAIQDLEQYLCKNLK